MEFIKSIINDLSALENQLDTISKNAIKENSSEIVTLVKRQLSHGRNSDNQPLSFTDGKQSGTGFYAESTQRIYDKDLIKSISGSQATFSDGTMNGKVTKTKGSPYNFHWTGETKDNMQMGEVGNGKYQVVTVKSRMSFLEGIYGEIFDANEKNNEWVNNEVVYPKLNKAILRTISI
jgi:hypothetical protein